MKDKLHFTSCCTALTLVFVLSIKILSSLATGQSLEVSHVISTTTTHSQLVWSSGICCCQPGTHWAMICVIRRLALTVSDVCLKLSCFRSTSTYSSLEISHFMCCAIVLYTFMTYLWPSHTQPRPHYVLEKLSGRRKNLYIVVGMQCKPTRTWYGLHECGGRGRTLDSAVFMVFVWVWRGYYLLLVLLLYSVLLLTSRWRRSYHRHHLHQSRAHQAPPTHRYTWSLTWHTSSQVNTCISQLHSVVCLARCLL